MSLTPLSIMRVGVGVLLQLSVSHRSLQPWSARTGLKLCLLDPWSQATDVKCSLATGKYSGGATGKTLLLSSGGCVVHLLLWEWPGSIPGRACQAREPAEQKYPSPAGKPALLSLGPAVSWG